MSDTQPATAARMSPDDLADMDELCGLTFPLHRAWRRVVKAWDRFLLRWGPSV